MNTKTYTRIIKGSDACTIHFSGIIIIMYGKKLRSIFFRWTQNFCNATLLGY